MPPQGGAGGVPGVGLPQGLPPGGGWGALVAGAALSPAQQAQERMYLLEQLDGLREEGIITSHRGTDATPLPMLRSMITTIMRKVRQQEAIDDMRDTITTVLKVLEFVNATLLRNFLNLDGIALQVSEELNKPQYRTAMRKMHRQVFGTTSMNPFLQVGKAIGYQILTLQGNAITGGGSTVGLLEVTGRIMRMFGLGAPAGEGGALPMSTAGGTAGTGAVAGLTPLPSLSGYATPGGDQTPGGTPGSATPTPGQTRRRRAFGS